MDPKNFQNSPTGQAIRTPTGYWTFVPNPLPPEINWTPELVSALSRADRSLTELAGLGHAFPNPYVQVRPFVRREAVLSSRIEGTHTSLEGLFTYEATQLSFLDADADAHEVYNYVVAMEYGLRRLAELPVSLRLLRELHVKLMQGVRGEHLTPGEFRRSQNWIGPPGSTLENAPYVPPPVEHMHQALDHLEKFIHAPSDFPPLTRLALIHYQFEAIHPFLDGNGRIGRLLTVLLLCEWDLLPQPLLYLSAFFETRRQDYYDHLLAISQRGTWHAWLLFFLEGIHIQSQAAIDLIARLDALRAKYFQMLQSERTVDRLMQLIDFLLGQPVVTVRQVENGIPEFNYHAAQRYIETLEKYGILHEITGGARNRVYRAGEIIQAMEGSVDVVD